MKSNAPGQFLGYSIQYPRALLHLLRAYDGDCISIELLGDVATHSSNETSLVEEDKSSVNSNPLTDKSENLWKTFSNWVDAINSKKLNIEKTHFLLFANKSGKEGFVNILHKASTDEEIDLAITQIKAALGSIDNDHAIWEYYNNVVNNNLDTFKGIIRRFELEVQEEGVYKDIEKELKKQHIGPNQINYFMDKIGGWLVRVIIEKLENKKEAIVSWSEYHKEFVQIYESSRRRELRDFTLENPIGQDAIENKIKQYPCFVRQLEEINESEDDINEAVLDYLKATTNRFSWIENEFIDEETAQDFEQKLCDFWKNKKSEIEVTGKNLEQSEKGKLLYYQCKQRAEKIGNQEPPAKTISGTYHALADTPVLGWHSNWEKFKGSN